MHSTYFLMDAADSERSQDLQEDSDASGSLERREHESNPPAIETGRILTPTANGCLELELTVKFKAMRSAWVAKYLFQLEPLSLDRVDRLETKMLLLEDKLAMVEARLATGTHQNATLLEVSSSRNTRLTKTGLVM
jgi:hypothetical protein